jgi:ankyrin repeat protein
MRFRFTVALLLICSFFVIGVPRPAGAQAPDPLIVAVMSTRPEVVKQLLDDGADPSKRAEDPAIGNAVTAAFFAMNGVELTGRSDELDARKHAAALEVLRLVASRKKGLDQTVRRAQTNMTALMIAAQAGALDAVQVLLEAGANPNATNAGGYTALDFALEAGPAWARGNAVNRPAVVRALQAAGGKAKGQRRG